jgi:hypothetical protein
MKISLQLACQLVLALPLLAAGVPAERIRETEQKQTQLGADVKQLANALDVMLGEYARNHLAGAEVETVERLRTSIDQLSAAEMKQVVDLLQQARAVQDPRAGVRTAADAYSAQMKAVTSMQRILTEHARKQQVQETAKQLNGLADRQARNLQNGIELARMGAAAPKNFENVQEAQLETQRGEQAAIAEELNLAAIRLRKAAAEATTAEHAQQLKAAAQQLDQTQPRAERAVEALKNGKLVPALGDEKQSRDELRKIAQALAPRERGPDALRMAERELAGIIKEQEQLATETGQQKAATDFDVWLDQKLTTVDPNKSLEGKYRRMSREQMRTSKDLRTKFAEENEVKAGKLAKLEDVQGELAGKSDHFGQDLADVPQATQKVREAVGKMQEAQAAMLKANAPAAQQQQQAALAQMQAAHAELQRKAEESELLGAQSGDKVKDLERLRSAVENLAKEEAGLAGATAPDAAQQAEMARRIEQFGKRAAELAPAASPALKTAAIEAKAAEKSLQSGEQAQGRQDAKEASQALTKAAEQIAHDLANTQLTQAQKEQAEASIAALAKLIQAEQKLELDTARAEALKNTEALKKLVEQQTAVKEQTTAFLASLPGAMDATVLGLKEAENAMDQAAQALKKGEGKEAREAEQQALKELFKSQKNLDQIAKAAAEQLGQQYADPKAMAEAANKIAQAMQDVNQADGALEKIAEQMGQQAAQNAAQAAQQAAEAAKQAAKAAQTAQQQAQQAGDEGAAQQAGDAQKQAQQAMQAAQKAMEAAQRMANQSGAPAQQSAENAAEQAGLAMELAQKAAQSAQKAGQGEQNAAAQASGQAAQAAQKAAQAAQQAQQMAKAAGAAAKAGAQQGNAAMQKAGEQFSEAALAAALAAAQQSGEMSPAMQEALKQAAQQLSNATNQSMQGENAAARESAQKAMEQLAEAANQAASMQAGLSQSSSAKPPGEGPEGQGMKGEGKKPGAGKGNGPTKQAKNDASEGAMGYQPGGTPEAVQRAARQAAIKSAGFLGLPARERAAILQSQAEKYPEEYGAMVEQYLLNLSKEAGKK